jgi:hypothetical protein
MARNVGFRNSVFLIGSCREWRTRTRALPRDVDNRSGERGLLIKSKREQSALVEFCGRRCKDLFTAGFTNDFTRYAARECSSRGRDSRHQIPIGRVRIRLLLFSLQSAFRALVLDIGFHSCSLTLHGIALQLRISLSYHSQFYAADAPHAGAALWGRSPLAGDVPYCGIWPRVRGNNARSTSRIAVPVRPAPSWIGTVAGFATRIPRRAHWIEVHPPWRLGGGGAIVLTGWVRRVAGSRVGTTNCRTSSSTPIDQCAPFTQRVCRNSSGYNYRQRYSV